MAKNEFRQFIYPPGHPRAARFVGKDAYTQAEEIRASNPEALLRREESISVPFSGITTDGVVINDLFALGDNAAPTASMLDATNDLFQELDADQRRQVSYDIDAIEWRRWHNAEMYFHHVGLRLEEVSLSVRDAILEVVRASLSATGYEMVRTVMRFNGFLGEVVGAPVLLGEWSYNFSIFGTPSMTDPWGWAMFGHHLAVNCVVVGRQMVITPTFYGAEPNYIDEGPHEGARIFEAEERLGLDLVHSLSPELQREAVLFDKIRDPAIPPGRVHRGDQLHLGGAYQDNRVIPYEGVRVDVFSPRQRRRLLEVASIFLKELPPGPLNARLEEIERHLDHTYFCWIGARDGVDPFYFRIQSPVVLIEFDQHPGVFLSNEQPERFHVHTIVRTPNGGDYGKDLLRLHYELSHRSSTGSERA